MKRSSEELVTLYALAVREPWATLIMRGRDCENRTWRTNYRGPLLIHAARAIDRAACRKFRIDPSTLKPGHILGLVTLVDVVENHHSPWAERGCFHWLMSAPHSFDVPLAASGKLKLFPVSIPEHLLRPRIA